MDTDTKNTILNAIEEHNMIFLSAQEDKVYFHWQIELYLHQFSQHGIIDRCYALLGYKVKPSKGAERLKRLYPNVIKFYKDERVNSCYTPNIRPHIYKKFFRDNPELGKNVFFHDSDIFLIKLPRFDLMMEDYQFNNESSDTNETEQSDSNTEQTNQDNENVLVINTKKETNINDDDNNNNMITGINATIGYVSDTISYIGYKYISSCCDRYFKVHGKSNNYDKFDIFNKMCEAAGVDKEMIKSRDKQSGGAQYLFKNMDYEFWDECEKVNEKMYKMFIQYEKKYPIPHHIQKWTTDMWTCLWLYWKRGDTTIVHKELDFSWATGTVREYRLKNIFHLAGITGSHKKRFHKGRYHSKCVFEEYNKDRCIFDHIEKNNATYSYTNVIKEYFNNHYAQEKGYMTDEEFFQTSQGRSLKEKNRDDFGKIVKGVKRSINKNTNKNVVRRRSGKKKKPSRVVNTNKRVNPLMRIIKQNTNFSDYVVEEYEYEYEEVEVIPKSNDNKKSFTVVCDDSSTYIFDGTYELTNKKCCGKNIWCSTDDMYIIYHNGGSWIVTYKQFESEIGRGTGGIGTCYGEQPYMNDWNTELEITIHF